MKRYENFVGLTEVKAAQARVVEREKKFIEQQELRREAQAKITEVQKRIKVRSLLPSEDEIFLLIDFFLRQQRERQWVLFSIKTSQTYDLFIT